MGFMRHDAIVVTDWNGERLKAAHAKAVELGLPVSNIVPAKINDEASFLIAPDGSKDGWDESNKGDEARDAWKLWVRTSGGCLDWCHVSFGSDEPDRAHLVDHDTAKDEEG